MAGHGFGGADGNIVFAEQIADRDGLQLVADGRGGAVRIYVADISRLQLGVADRIAHHAESAFVLGSRRGDVVGVAAHAVANNFRHDLRTRAPWRAPALRESECPSLRRPRIHRDPCPMDGWRVPVRHCGWRARAWQQNPPTLIGVIAASAPPAIITSASPR